MRMPVSPTTHQILSKRALLKHSVGHVRKNRILFRTTRLTFLKYTHHHAGGKTAQAGFCQFGCKSPSPQHSAPRTCCALVAKRRMDGQIGRSERMEVSGDEVGEEQHSEQVKCRSDYGSSKVQLTKPCPLLARSKT